MIQFCLTAVIAFFTLFFFVAAKFNKQQVRGTDKYAKYNKHFLPVPSH